MALRGLNELDSRQKHAGMTARRGIFAFKPNKLYCVFTCGILTILMVAHILKILALLQIASAIAIFALAMRVWHVSSMTLALVFGLFGLGLVFLVRILITAHNFYLAWRYRSKTPAGLRLSWRQTCYLFLEEFNATMLSSSWTMIRHSFTKRPVEKPVGLPVLLIHGYGCNSGYWIKLSEILTQESISQYAMNLEPVFAGIDEYVPLVAATIETMCRETGQQKIIILAHSMGGLVARAYMRDHGVAKIASIITLGTPHHGTGLANYGIGLNSRQMRRASVAKGGKPSEWLQQLAEKESDTQRAIVISIYSHHDNIVSPQTSSHLAGAENIAFYGIGHVALALNPKIQQCVIEEIHRVYSHRPRPC